MCEQTSRVVAGAAAVLASAVAAFLLPSGASGYLTSPGSGTASARVGTLAAPAVDATRIGPLLVRLSWTAVPAPTGAADDGAVTFTVERARASGPWAFVCGTAAAPKPHDVLGCDDLVPASGEYDYRVTARFRTWTSEGAGSVTVAGDTTPPAVVSVARDHPSPTSAASVRWTVTFDESVTGVDATDFALAGPGASGAGVTAVSGGGAVWTVEAGTGADGSLRLDLVDDDSIADLAGNALGGPGTGNGAFAGDSYLVDRTAPVVLSIDRAGASPTNAGPLSWTVAFSEPVSGVVAADFGLVSSGVAGTPTITSATPSGPVPTATWTVSASVAGVTGTNAGSIRLDLTSAGVITDAAANPISGTFTGQAYAYDTTAPAVTSITRLGPSPTNAASVSWTVAFSEDVAGVGVSDFALVASGVSGASITSVTGGPASYTVAASTGTGDGTLRLDLVDDDSIADAAGNPLGGPGAGSGSLAGEAYTLDRTPPVITQRCPVNGGSYTNDNNGSSSWSHAYRCRGAFSVTVTGAASVTVSLRRIGGLCWSGSATGSVFTAPCPNQVALTSTSGSTWSRPLSQSALPDGSYTAVVTATDASGNTATLTIGFTIT